MKLESNVPLFNVKVDDEEKMSHLVTIAMANSFRACPMYSYPYVSNNRKRWNKRLGTLHEGCIGREIAKDKNIQD